MGNNKDGRDVAQGNVTVHTIDLANSPTATLPSEPGSAAKDMPSLNLLVQDSTLAPYQLYKRRFVGAFGIVVLNIVGGMNWPWFGPIATSTSATFGISLDQVNWLGNIVALTYLACAPVVPIMRKRYGLRFCYMFGAGCLIVAAWVRYAGTARTLGSGGAYTLLILGQLISAIGQCIFQVLPPKYSEAWFDLRGRTTATMIMSIANPVGGGLGQFISPLVGDTRSAILVLGIISTVAAPVALLIQSAPPTPPSYSGSHSSPTFLTTLKAIAGKLPKPASTFYEPTPALRQGTVDSKTTVDRSATIDQNAEVNAYMHPRERLDFAILFMVFGTLVAATNSFALLSNQILGPYGYSEDTAGFMGAALLLSGIVAAFITSPLFDRVFTHHLGLAARIFCPIIGATWLSLIFAVRPNNDGALFALYIIIGVCGVSILPVGLELGCELTRNADASSAILWWSGNLWGIIFVVAQSALRAPEDASPPLNMHRAIIFNGAFVLAVVSLIFVFRGRQVRREKDVQMREIVGVTQTARA